MASFLSGAMSSLSRNVKVCWDIGSKLLSSPTNFGCQQTQVRTKYVCWRMRRDAKRRDMIKSDFPERQRLNVIRKNNILPKEIQELADTEVAALPRDSSIVRVRRRCLVTSRPRGVQRPWRLSRIVWRNLADYNQMSGVTRSSW